MIDELRLFLQVIEAGSLSKAAINQGLAVSSVTRKIDRLEEEMGMKLLLRNSRSLKLTDAGEQFIATARNIVAEMDDAKASMRDAQSDPRGLLTVTAPSAFGRRHVLPAVASFLKLYPHIELDLHLDDHLVDLSEHRVDVAIRIGLLPDSDLIATNLAPSVRIVCASPDYIKKRGAPNHPEELLQHNCLSVGSRPLPACWWCFAGVNREAALPVKGNFRANDTETLLGAVLEGLGIVHLATWLVSDKIMSGELIPLLSDFVLPSPRAIHAVRLPGRSHNLKAKLFINHLKQTFGAPAYWDKPFLPFK